MIWILSLVILFTATATATPSEEWKGIVVSEEHRCSGYYREKDYPYSSPSLEPKIVDRMGGHIYGPYTGRYFQYLEETEVEHIVAISEAHDSGLCAAAAETRKRFAKDLDNLTLADPEVNQKKLDKDATEWLPDLNQCWFAERVVAVKRKYDLTMDKCEQKTLKRILSKCESTELVFIPKPN